MAAHQCPRCPLRFSFRTELELHLREDHDRGLHAEVARPARQPAVRPDLTDQTGQRPDELLAASRTALMVSSRSDLSPAGVHRSSSPDVKRVVGASDGLASPDVHGVDRPLPPVTLMPRWVVVTVIALIVFLLGLGLLYGT